MPELDVSQVLFRVTARPLARVGVSNSTGAQVILVPTPGPPGDEGPTGPAGDGAPVFGETLTGANGAVTDFTTDNPYKAGSTAVYLNGLREFNTEGYTELSPDTIRFTDPPSAADSIRIDYLIL